MFTDSADHLADSRLTYMDHFLIAMGYSARLFGASIACAVHAVIPGVFTTTASRVCEAIMEDVLSRRGALR